jgi:DNA-binding transcriptional ArsR family regulator
MEIKEAAGALAALAQESRLSIFRLLIKAGPQGLSVGRIAEALEIPGATLSFHLKELARAGLVSSQKEKQFFYYSVDFARMAELMTFLTQNCCRGMPEECLSGVENALSRCCTPQPSRKRKTKTRRNWV